MADITNGTWINNGKAADAVYQSGVKVYGRNLYVDTKNFDNSSAWINSGACSKTEETLNGLTVLKTNSSWNGLGQTIQAKKGENYTFSLYARYQSGTGNSNMYFDPTGVTNTNPRTVRVYLDETWKLLIGTFTITNDGPVIARIERTNNNTNTLLIAGIKLELGATATPYSQAPEDILN